MQSQLVNELANRLNCSEKEIEIGIYENSSGVKYTLEEFLGHYNPEEIGKGQCKLVFTINLGRVTVGSFQLQDMYNCCGIIVGSDLFVSKKVRNMGVGTLLTKFMYDFSSYYGYGILQGADKRENEYQTRIFEKLGWQKSSEFKNPKTGNILNIWLLNLQQEVIKYEEHENK